MVAPNDGNVEYLRDRENCLLYHHGNLQEAVDEIMRISCDRELRGILYAGGLAEAQKRDWSNLSSDIITNYI